MLPDLLARKRTHFVLWRPADTAAPPRLVIGTFQAGATPSLANERTFTLRQAAGTTDLWEIAAADCGLADGTIYHYWFEVVDSNVYVGSHVTLRIADPAAYAVDWRLTFPFPAPYNQNPAAPFENVAPSGVILFRNGSLLPADPDAEPNAFAQAADVPMRTLPPNHRLVIYELPTAWTKAGDLLNAQNVGVGTFRDVRALIEHDEAGSHFSDVPAVSGSQHLIDLGVNALELLPPADTYFDRKSWGYATSNYFAPDFDLGRPLNAASGGDASTAVGDFLNLVRSCHTHGIRFFYDAVMAFGRNEPYRAVNFFDYHVQWGSGDPEQGSRDGFNGDLWKYGWNPTSYDPVSGGVGPAHPARRHMITHLLHWMSFYHVDGLRLDSVNNFGSWDFAGEVRDTARAAWNARWSAEGNAGSGADERFLVIGEELSVPKGLLGRLDALWNERFKQILRQVILGRNAENEPSFEWSVRKLIDCRNLNIFGSLHQAVNYIGSHDVGGYSNERFYNYLDNNGVVLKEKQIKLAFVCLLTAVGIPMILAGDEFGEESNFKQTTDANKEIDPVNFEHAQQPWRKSVFDYVSRLVKLRTTSDALSVNETDFIHVDFTWGKRVLAWKRGRKDVDDPVVVVANFSDWGTDDPLNPAARYDVANFPGAPAGKRWREVSRGYDAPRAGSEPLFPWEAKVYALV